MYAPIHCFEIRRQVVGFIELLGQTSLTPEQSDFVKSLQSSTISLMSIINDVLDFTKLEAGKMEIETIPFDPTAICKGCLEIVKPIAEKKGLSIRCELEGGDGGNDGCATTVLGDPNRIRQVILNLLSNAVKFTHTGGITLRLTMSRLAPGDDNHHPNNNGNNRNNNARLRFSVEDTGIGVSAEHTENIFDKYRQSDATVARQYGGTGLGLAICKILAEAMQGTLHLSSQVNEGSEFTFEIPVEVSAPEVMDRMEEDDSEILLEQERSLHILVAEGPFLARVCVCAGCNELPLQKNETMLCCNHRSNATKLDRYTHHTFSSVYSPKTTK